MGKAYDLKVLVERLKARGLDLAEDAAMLFVEELEAFVIESALLSKTPYDDILVPIMPQLTKKLKADVVDKIDGKDELQ